MIMIILPSGKLPNRFDSQEWDEWNAQSQKKAKGNSNGRPNQDGHSRGLGFTGYHESSGGFV